MSWGPTFDHEMSDFNAAGLLARVGMSKIDPDYPKLLVTAKSIIERNVLNLARKLNSSLSKDYAEAMSTMTEYVWFSAYISHMQMALSDKRHVGIYYKNKVIQARFIDTSLIGGVKDLINIQRIVYPESGTLEGWIRLYNEWRIGKSTLYVDIVTKRLSYMGMGAPYLELVEYGNDRYKAYPINAAAGILQGYVWHYQNLMHFVFGNCYCEILPIVQASLIKEKKRMVGKKK